MSVEEAAWGIHQIANENMANAARVHALERGKDPHRFPLFAFGGAGPVHAYRIALALGAPALLAPFGAGVMSTVGFLAAPLAFDFVRSWPGRLDALDWERANALLAEMEAEGQALNTIATGGSSSSGTVSSPAIGASGSCFEEQRAELRNLDGIVDRLASLSGMPNRTSGAPSGWLS